MAESSGKRHFVVHWRTPLAKSGVHCLTPAENVDVVGKIEHVRHLSSLNEEKVGQMSPRELI